MYAKGADVDALRDSAYRMTGFGNEVDVIRSTAKRAVHAMERAWQGPDLQPVLERWRRAEHELHVISKQFEQTSRRLHHNIDAQRRSSGLSAGGYSSHGPAGGHGQASGHGHGHGRGSHGGIEATSHLTPHPSPAWQPASVWSGPRDGWHAVPHVASVLHVGHVLGVGASHDLPWGDAFGIASSSQAVATSEAGHWLGLSSWMQPLIHPIAR